MDFPLFGRCLGSPIHYILCFVSQTQPRQPRWSVRCDESVIKLQILGRWPWAMARAGCVKGLQPDDFELACCSLKFTILILIDQHANSKSYRSRVPTYWSLLISLLWQMRCYLLTTQAFKCLAKSDLYHLNFNGVKKRFKHSQTNLDRCWVLTTKFPLIKFQVESYMTWIAHAAWLRKVDRLFIRTQWNWVPNLEKTMHWTSGILQTSLSPLGCCFE